MDLPRRLAIAGTIAVSSLALVACSGSAPGQGGGGGGESPAASIAKSYTVKPGDTTPFALADGTYRLGWTSGCTNIELALTGDNGFENKKPSKLPSSARIITSVPAGNYTITQSDPACTQWTATIDKVG
jgi:hypothetical protein